MESTYRWYRLRVAGEPILPADLRRKLLRARTEETWFAKSEEVASGIRFFRRSNLSVEQYDNRGERSVQTVEVVSSMELRIFVGQSSTLLRVHNPGRSTRPLLNLLEGVLGYGFSATAVVFEKEPHQVLRKADVKRMVSLKITDVALRPDCVARMEFVSREGLDPSTITFLRGVSYRKDFTKYELVYNGLRGTFSYGVSGLVKVGGGASDLIVGLLEQELLSAS